MGYYKRDNAFYSEWDAIARDRDSFQNWIQEYVLDTKDHQQFLQVFEKSYSLKWRAAS
jgi:glutaconate CoA-transferase subunit A